MIGNMAEALSQEELEALHCWEPEDRVPGRPAMTEFRRGLRRHQALWREANGHPVGSHPIVPRSGKPSRSVGSRLPLDYARATGASFLTPEARDAARARTSFVEPHQSFDHQRFWADLLWSPTLAVNLFGELATDLPRVLWMIHLGLIYYWLIDESPNQQRTRRLTDTTLDLLVPLLRAASLPLMGPLRKRALKVIRAIDGE